MNVRKLTIVLILVGIFAAGCSGLHPAIQDQKGPGVKILNSCEEALVPPENGTMGYQNVYALKQEPVGIKLTKTTAYFSSQRGGIGMTLRATPIWTFKLDSNGQIIEEYGKEHDIVVEFKNCLLKTGKKS